MPVSQQLPPLETGQTCLAVFDFDGTLTRRDSMFAFIRFAVGWPRMLIALAVLSPLLSLNRIGLVDNQTAKERLLGQLFGGWTYKQFTHVAKRFSEQELDRLIRPDARQRLIAHQRAGHDIVVVSASLELWLAAWCEENGITLLGSRIQLDDGHISGKLEGLNCTGPEKVRRLTEQYDIDDYHSVYAYGDSKGDADLLALVDQPAFRAFNG